MGFPSPVLSITQNDISDVHYYPLHLFISVKISVERFPSTCWVSEIFSLHQRIFKYTTIFTSSKTSSTKLHCTFDFKRQVQANIVCVTTRC